LIPDPIIAGCGASSVMNLRRLLIRSQLTQVEGLMGKQVELVRELMPQATTVGTEAVTRAPADGHMLLLVVPANVDPAGLVGSSPSTCYRACP
jgi:hypothetical protein